VRKSKNSPVPPGNISFMHNSKSPEGLDFFRLTDHGEDKCQKLTDDFLAKESGLKAPVTLEKLGTVLSLADRIGSCFWSCPGNASGSHVIQYLTSRTGSYGRAIIRLARLGFYDEALNLLRSLGEIGNLFTLFSLNPSAKSEWQEADKRTRIKRFGPGPVRDAVSKLGGVLLMSADEYHRLCEISTHPVPTLVPQNFNPHGRGIAGGFFQQAGILVVLNETSVLVSAMVFLAARLCDVPEEQRLIIERECVECVKATGEVSLSRLPEMWKDFETDKCQKVPK